MNILLEVYERMVEPEEMPGALVVYVAKYIYNNNNINLSKLTG